MIPHGQVGFTQEYKACLTVYINPLLIRHISTMNERKSVVILIDGGKSIWQYLTIFGFSGDSLVKNPPPIQEIQVQSLRQQDLLEKEMATHSSNLDREIPWTEELGRLQSLGLQKTRLSD